MSPFAAIARRAVARPLAGRRHRRGDVADVIVVDTRAPHLQPMFDPIAQVVYAAKGRDSRKCLLQARNFEELSPSGRAVSAPTGS
jgi:hypothetical protein